MTLEPKSSSIVITVILEFSHPHLWILSQLLMHLMLPLAPWLSSRILQFHRPTALYLCLTPQPSKIWSTRVHRFSSVGSACQRFCLADWCHCWCILSRQFPQIDSPQSVCLLETGKAQATVRTPSADWVQIIQINHCHWITTSNLTSCHPNAV